MFECRHLQIGLFSSYDFFKNPISMGDRTARGTISPGGPAWAGIVIGPSDAMPGRA